jgi:hypothetical protein
MAEPRLHQNGPIPISSRKMVRFAANIPVDIALQGVDGIRVEGRYGDRVKYTLTDDRTMCVDPLVAERIKELAIQPGELFQICKRQAKMGNRKTIHWSVEQPDSESPLERDLRASLERAKAPDIAPQPAPEIPIFPQNVFYELDPSARPSTDDTPRRLPDTQLAHALKTAIAAAADAEKFAKTLDYSIRFSTEDVRSMGITILIGMQQRTQR